MKLWDDLMEFLKPLKPLYDALDFVGKKVALVVNTVLLTIVYFTAFAATAIIAKLLRKHFLDLSIDKATPTYWLEAKKEDHTKKEPYRPF